jgi:amidase
MEKHRLHFAFCLTLTIPVLLYHRKLMNNSHKMWEKIANEAQALRDETLAKVGENIEIPAQLSRNVTDTPDKALSASSSRITSLAPQEIISLVSERKISAQEVVQAFLERAVVAQNLVGHLTCPFDDCAVKC